ncbi:MAG: GNAT family N-acetyltransferase [Bacteroidota bacterium]
MTVRKGEKSDLPAVFALMLELAEYENGLDQVSNTVDQMLIDGFGPDPVFGLLVAEQEGEVIGSSIYYYRYSTWKGKQLYLEDLVVTEQKRRTGAGKLLFEKTIEIAREEKCTGMVWQVLNWNEPAIQFYKHYQSNFDKGWTNCSIIF